MTTTLHTDQKLLDELRQGRNGAFRRVYEDYWNMVRYFVMQNSGTEQDAADIFQEGIIVLFEKVRSPAFLLTSSLKTYLYSICRNLWLKVLRQRGKELHRDFEEVVEIAEEEENPEDARVGILQKCMNLLGDSCKQLLERFYYLRQDMKQISREMGYAGPDVVKAQKYKCVQQLRKLANTAGEK